MSRLKTKRRRKPAGIGFRFPEVELIRAFMSFLSLTLSSDTGSFALNCSAWRCHGSAVSKREGTPQRAFSPIALSIAGLLTRHRLSSAQAASEVRSVAVRHAAHKVGFGVLRSAGVVGFWLKWPLSLLRRTWTTFQRLSVTARSGRPESMLLLH